MSQMTSSLPEASVYQYSLARTRSLIAMTARRAIKKVNGSASLFLVKPFVVLAARVLGPGPTRLRLVKLAHSLGQNGEVMELAQAAYDEDKRSAVQPTSRAA